MKHFTFTDKEIARYEDECDELKKQQKLKYNIENCLGNYELSHWLIIADNITDDDTIDWDSISENEILDDQFIYNYGSHLNWTKLIRYQRLSRVIIKNNSYYIDLYDLSCDLIKYQKLHYTLIELLSKEMCYWVLLVKYQKLGETMSYRMIKEMKTKHPEDSLEFNRLIIKHQLKK